MIQTYGFLKHGLMQSGVHIADETRAAREVADGFFKEDEETKITFAFCDDFFVRTFVTPETGGAEVLVRGGNVMLHTRQATVEVDVVPPPRFLQKYRAVSGPLARNVDLDGSCMNLFLRIMPQCAEGLNMPVDGMIAVIGEAFAEGEADLVQLNVDYHADDDRGFSFLAPLIQKIRKNFNAFISLRGFPPRHAGQIDAIYAAGIDLINFPLEGFAAVETARRDVAAGKIAEALAYAAGIFPRGAVSTEMDFGHPLELLKEKIDLLAAQGVVPKIRLPRQMSASALEHGKLAGLARHLHEAARCSKLDLKWIYPSGLCVTPLDAAFFIAEPKDARLAARPVYHSALGKKATGGFAALRRKLRVRNISDSYESAGL